MAPERPPEAQDGGAKLHKSGGRRQASVAPERPPEAGEASLRGA